MRLLLGIFAILAVIACPLLRSSSSSDLFKNMPENDYTQKPGFIMLPDEDGDIAGCMFTYNFSRDLIFRERFGLLGLIIDTVREQKMIEDTDGKVVILAYKSPQRDVSITADYLKNEIDVLEESNAKTKYRYRAWKGDVDMLLQYFIEGRYFSPTQKKFGGDVNNLFIQLRQESKPKQGV